VVKPKRKLRGGVGVEVDEDKELPLTKGWVAALDRDRRGW
jgi:hypothetical protein